MASRTPLGRGRARWWIASLVERLRAGPVDVERLGLKLRLHYYGKHACDKKMLFHVALPARDKDQKADKVIKRLHVTFKNEW